MINLPLNTKIGVMFSGGLDSSILLFLLHKKNFDLNLGCEIIPYSVSRRTGTIHHTKNVVEWQKNYFQRDLPDTVYVGDPNVHHSIFVAGGIKEAFDKHDPKFIFMGCTLNPPENELITNLAKPERPKSKTFRVQQPFLGFDKRLPVRLYYEHGVEEMLRPTHSCCERVFGRCGECYFCIEREWAFKSQNLIDLGSN